MIELAREMIDRKLADQDYEAGCSFIYISLENGWGVKLLKDAHEGSKDFHESTMRNQALAAANDLGPMVGESFEICVDKVNYFCYITEEAEILLPSNQSPNVEFSYDAFDQAEEQHYDQMRVLQDKLSDVGFEFGDFHAGNVGYLRGELVCIDFGE